MSKAISVSTGGFSRSFHQMEGICVNFLDHVQFFRFLEGRCHGNQFCVVPGLFTRNQSISVYAGPIFTIFALYGKYWIADGMGYCYFNVHVNSTNDASISCKNFVNCGPVTPEKTGRICVLFYDMAKKLAYLVKYLRIYSTDFYNLSTIWKCFECRW